jgi:hypothetical protein
MNNEESKRLVDEANARDAMSPDELRKDNFTRMFPKSDQAMKEYMQDRFSPKNIISRALDGFYAAYLQLNLPACLQQTLQEETKRMVQELYVTDPEGCRNIIIHIIEQRGRGKSDGYIQRRITDADGWIHEFIVMRNAVEAQLNEQSHGDNSATNHQV